MKPIAIVGAVTDSYVHATTMRDLGPIDLPLARRQHASYVAALVELGFDIHRVEVDDANPDAVFVEDQAVVIGRRALVTHSGHPGRRAEADTVARALGERGLEIVRMPETAILDGGDVLRLGSRVWVGLSRRSDAAGVAFLAGVFPECEVQGVPLPEGILHLKCVCTIPVPGVIVVADDAPPIRFGPEAERIVRIPAAESWAANLLGRGNRVLVGAGYPETEAALRAADLEPLVVDVSEIRRGDGSLTCLSILC